MPTTTIWIPGASARANDLHDVFTSEQVPNDLRSELIEDTAIIFSVPIADGEQNKKVTFYIPIPTVSILNDAQLYLKRFKINLEFPGDTPAPPLTIYLYGASDEPYTDINPVITPTYEHTFKTALKINTSLLIGLEVNILSPYITNRTGITN
ncbi:MAG: hypothetical protein ABI359_05005 [Ginsengibacter sp.]